MTTEIAAIQETVYGLQITPSNEDNVEAVQSIVDSILVGNHQANFQAIASIEDSKKGSISRMLTDAEKNKIYDLNIEGKFSEAEKMEQELGAQWTANFLTAFKEAQ